VRKFEAVNTELRKIPRKTSALIRIGKTPLLCLKCLPKREIQSKICYNYQNVDVLFYIESGSLALKAQSPKERGKSSDRAQINSNSVHYGERRRKRARSEKHKDEKAAFAGCRGRRGSGGRRFVK
jgi:hypothetical protein